MLNDQLLCNPLKEDEPFDPSLILNDHDEERNHFSNSSSLTSELIPFLFSIPLCTQVPTSLFSSPDPSQIARPFK